MFHQFKTIGGFENMKISSILCRKCQNDNANHTTEYCPTHICKNCGGSGHVSKVCPKKETTKKPNSPHTSPSPIKKSINSLTLSQFKEVLVITKKYNKRTKLSLPSDENLEINVSPSTSDCSDNVFEVHTARTVKDVLSRSTPLVLIRSTPLELSRSTPF